VTSRLALAFAILPAVAALPTAAEEKPLLDGLPQQALQSAFQVLRRDYIRREDLSFEELNRAALQGLLQRLDFGAEIVSLKSDAKPAAAGVHAEFLGPDIAYVRPESFGEGEGLLFDKSLRGLVEKRARHLILDLRAGGRGQFEEAARMLECFVPPGELMFKMKQLNSADAELFVSQQAPLWSGQVVVLVDEETGNAAEALAACLHAQGRALVVGAKTRGATVRYTQVQLDEKAALRYASAEMLLPDGSSLFKKGLTPHFSVPADPAEKRKAFAGSRGKSLVPFVQDRARGRFNERALVNSLNPELDDYVRRSKGQPLPGDEGQVRDVVTQRALDLLLGNEFAAQAKINWDAKPAESAPFPQSSIPKAEPSKPVQP
jgi:hypothetical protein